MQRITWRVRRIAGAGGWEGEITFPDRHGFEQTVKAQAGDKVRAVKRAGNLASKLASDPAVQAILPPGGAAALQAVGKLASSQVAKKIGRKAASALRSLF